MITPYDTDHELWYGDAIISWKVGISSTGREPFIFSNIRFSTSHEAKQYKAWLYQNMPGPLWAVVAGSRLEPTHVFYEGIVPKWWKPWRRSPALKIIKNKAISY